MIGVFDSGLGGLSVLAAIAQHLPQGDLVYCADSAHVPYGSRDDGFIVGRALAIGEYLLQHHGCRQLVVACNTATAAAAQALRDAHPGIPIVGVEPGIKPAAQQSRTGHIAVLATESTARSDRLRRLIRDHAGDVAVHIVPCPGWATQVESLRLDAPEFVASVQRTVAPLRSLGVDQVVLGCTHYSFLAPQLTAILGPDIALIDVADAVARQTVRLAAGHAAGRGSLRMAATARPEQLMAALPRLGLASLRSRIHQPAMIAAV